MLTLSIASVFGIGMSMTAAISSSAAPVVRASTTAASTTGGAVKQIDCNGYSPIQSPLRANTCTDLKGDDSISNANTWGGRVYDNGHYIGHDEPDATFLSNAPGSGNNVSWTLTVGRDPSAPPGDANPGHDVSHYFELTPAPWFSMALCDPNSYPETPCTPNSDSNAPTCLSLVCPGSASPGGGSAFMEVQLYPPGIPPFPDSVSCDDTHWCAALTIDSYECNAGYSSCNDNCLEPQNFAFIQDNGVPDPNGLVPDDKTFLINPGDKISIHMFDAPAAGGGDAVDVVFRDLTNHTSGSMQASAANGFANTDPATCALSPFNFQPEYNTAARDNIIPWAAIQTDISTEFETGHWESCTSLSDELSSNPFDPSDTGGTYNECAGPYENAGPPDNTTNEAGDALCYYAGDTHTGYAGPGTSSEPDEATGCQDNLYQNGDLDFDGTPYYPEWPTGNKPTIYPSTFVEQFPTTDGQAYSQYFFQTDVALSEPNCQGSPYTSGGTASGCTVPPQGPGGFYPYWSGVKTGNVCALEFGNVSSEPGSITDFGKDAQYGQDTFNVYGYPEFIGHTHNDNCRSSTA